MTIYQVQMPAAFDINKINIKQIFLDTDNEVIILQGDKYTYAKLPILLPPKKRKWWEFWK